MAKRHGLARAVRMRHAAAAGGLAAVLAATALWLWSEGGASTFPVAYVVCGGDYRSESRAYRVDLLAGEVTDVSEPLEWVGQPHHLAYNAVRSRLYFASMNKKWSPPMWPVTSLRVGGGEFEVAGRFPTSRENNLLEKARAGEAPPSRKMMAEPMREAYRVVVSPDGRELYVSYGGLHKDTGAIMQVWDADTGEILRGLRWPIPGVPEWSPDGDYVAHIWPSHDRKVYEDGEAVIKARKGGVSVINMRTDERRLEDNKGFHPPWGRIEEPLVHLFNRVYMEDGEVGVYDRDTDEVLSKLGIRQLTGLTLAGTRAGNPAIAVLEGGRLIAVSAVERLPPIVYHWPNSVVSQERGYVVLVDVMERREVSRTRVGARCTNAVVAYE